jgi:TIR domain
VSDAIIFLCYSHEDAAWRELILKHLAVLEQPQEGLTVWSDKEIVVGEQWRQKIEDALNQACVAILLVSPNFFSSEFIKNKEIPALLQRYNAKDGLKIIPIIASDCAWKLKPWLENMDVRPKDGHGLFQRGEAVTDTELTNVVIEIADILKKVAPSLTSQASADVKPDKPDTAKPAQQSRTGDTGARSAMVGQLTAELQKDPQLGKDIFDALKKVYEQSAQAKSSKEFSQKAVKSRQGRGLYSKSKSSKV